MVMRTASAPMSGAEYVERRAIFVGLSRAAAERVRLQAQQLNPEPGMRDRRARRIAGMKLVLGVNSIACGADTNDSIAAQNADGIRRAARIAGHAEELHAQRRSSDGDGLGRGERELLTERNGRRSGTTLVARRRKQQAKGD